MLCFHIVPAAADFVHWQMWFRITRVVAHYLLVARERQSEIWQNNTLVLVAACTKVSKSSMLE